MFTCPECKQKKRERERVFATTDWCKTCVDAESQRSIREDTTPGQPPYLRARPPKFMLPPERYAAFGYK